MIFSPLAVERLLLAPATSLGTSDSPAAPAPAAAAAAQAAFEFPPKTNMSNKQIKSNDIKVDVIACLTLHNLSDGVIVINNISNVRSTVNGDTIVQSNLVERLNENPESVGRNIHGACFRFHRHGSNGVGKQLRNSFDGKKEQYWCELVDEGECYKVLNKIFEGVGLESEINDSSLLFEDAMIRRLRMFMDIMFDPTSSDNTRVVEWIKKQDWVVPVIIPQNNGGVKEESESVDAVKQFLHTSPDRNLLKRFVLLNFARLSGVFFAISDGLHRIHGALKDMYNKLGGNPSPAGQPKLAEDDDDNSDVRGEDVTFDLNVLIRPQDCTLAEFLSLLLIKSLSCDQDFKIGFNILDAMRALLEVINLRSESKELVLLEELMKALFEFIASEDYLQVLIDCAPTSNDYAQTRHNLNELQRDRQYPLEQEEGPNKFALGCDEFKTFLKECVQRVVKRLQGDERFEKKGHSLLTNFDPFWIDWVKLQGNATYPQWTKENRHIEVTVYQLTDMFYQLWSYSILKCMGLAMETIPQPTREMLGFRSEVIIGGRFSHALFLQKFVDENDGYITLTPGFHPTSEPSVKWNSKVCSHVDEMLEDENPNHTHLSASIAVLSLLGSDSSEAVYEFLRLNKDTDNLRCVFSWLSFFSILMAWGTNARSQVRVRNKYQSRSLRCLLGKAAQMSAVISNILPFVMNWIQGSEFSSFNEKVSKLLGRSLAVNDAVYVGCSLQGRLFSRAISSKKTSWVASCISQVIFIQLLYADDSPKKRVEDLLGDMLGLRVPLLQLGMLDLKPGGNTEIDVCIFEKLLDGEKANISKLCFKRLSEAVQRGEGDGILLLDPTTNNDPDNQDDENMESDSDDEGTFMGGIFQSPAAPAAAAAAAVAAANKTGSDENHNKNNGNGDETIAKRASEDLSGGTSAPPSKRPRPQPRRSRRSQNMNGSLLQVTCLHMAMGVISVPKEDKARMLIEMGATIPNVDRIDEFILREAEKYWNRFKGKVSKVCEKLGVTTRMATMKLENDDSDASAESSDEESDDDESHGGGRGIAAAQSSDDDDDDDDESHGGGGRGTMRAETSNEDSDDDDESHGGGGGGNSDEKGSGATAFRGSPGKKVFAGKGGKGNVRGGGRGIAGAQSSNEESDDDDDDDDDDDESRGGGGGNSDEKGSGATAFRGSPGKKVFAGKGNGRGNEDDSEQGGRGVEEQGQGVHEEVPFAVGDSSNWFERNTNLQIEEGWTHEEIDKTFFERNTNLQSYEGRKHEKIDEVNLSDDEGIGKLFPPDDSLSDDEEIAKLFPFTLR